MRKNINLSREVWEGWTVKAFIDELEPLFVVVQSGESWMPKMTNRSEVKKWCMENQPYYKGYIPEVVDYFCDKYNISNQ